MDFLRNKLWLLLAILIAFTLVIPACGPKAPPAPPPVSPPPLPGPPPPPPGNQPPVISSVTPAVTQTVPGGTIRIQCLASDPEGETPSFQWSATGGGFDTPSGPIVSWLAPSIYGTYNITVTVSDTKGGISQRTIVLSVLANQNPVISSLVADPNIVMPGPGPGSTSIITCIASDPDGDVVSFSWTATEGTITGVGNKITWQAPSKEGDFYVKVLVGDGKGGSTISQVLIRVATAQRTIVVPLTEQETGTVWSDGYVQRELIAGDDQNNRTARAFFSFNIFPFASKTVTNAKLTFTTRYVVGTPFPAAGGMNGLYVESVMYGARPLQSVDYNILGESLMPTYFQPPVEVDVTSRIAHLALSASPLFQVRARFFRESNGNAIADYIQFTTATLTVTYK